MALRGLLATWSGRAAVAAVVAVIVGTPLVVGRVTAAPAKADLRTAPVTRGAVSQTVSVAGSINAAATLRLNFRTAGRLDAVLVKVGDQVTSGQPVARLDVTDLSLSVGQAQANLASAQARYDQAVAGATPEDVAAARISVDNAQRSLESARRTGDADLSKARHDHARTTNGFTTSRESFLSLASQARADADGLIRTAEALLAEERLLLDQTATLPDGGDIRAARNAVAQSIAPLTNAAGTAATTLRAAIVDHDSATNVVRDRADEYAAALAAGRDTAATVALFSAAHLAYTAASTRLTSAIDVVTGLLGNAQASLVSAQAALNTTQTRGLIEYDGFRGTVATHVTRVIAAQQAAGATKTKVTQTGTSLQTVAEGVNGALFGAQQALTAAQDKSANAVSSAESSLASAQNSLAKTAPKQTDIATQYASLLQAQNALDKAQNDLSNATLRAPVSGVVAAITAQAGENVTTGGGTAFMTIANTTSLALHGTVGEGDVAKLRLGQVATVTVDAVGLGTRMTGKVTLIDPVATIQQGVPVYGVDITLDVPDAHVRPGMSGTAAVILASRTNVLTIPNLAIRTVGGKRVVQVLRNGEAVDADVQLGLSNDSVTEVVSGLQEGELVVLPQRTAPAGGQQGIQQLRGGGAPAPAIQVR